MKTSLLPVQPMRAAGRAGDDWRIVGQQSGRRLKYPGQSKLTTTLSSLFQPTLVIEEHKNCRFGVFFYSNGPSGLLNHFGY